MTIAGRRRLPTGHRCQLIHPDPLAAGAFFRREGLPENNQQKPIRTLAQASVEAHNSAMNWEKVNEFVEEWAQQQGLPKDFSGRTLTLVDFESEQDCHFFYPGRTLLSQKAFTSALAKWARLRHAKTEHNTINQGHYEHWRVAEKLEDTEENRARFIESRYRIVP